MKAHLQEGSILIPQTLYFSINIFIKEVSDYHDKAESGLGVLKLVVPQRKGASFSVALKHSIELKRNFLYIIIKFKIEVKLY